MSSTNGWFSARLLTHWRYCSLALNYLHDDSNAFPAVILATLGYNQTLAVIIIIYVASTLTGWGRYHLTGENMWQIENSLKTKNCHDANFLVTMTTFDDIGDDKLSFFSGSLVASVNSSWLSDAIIHTRIHMQLSSVWRQAIIWINARVLLAGPWGTHFGDFGIKLQQLS